jgi:putative effector of murein hydrolase LrgA (UPF0299 family)
VYKPAGIKIVLSYSIGTVLAALVATLDSKYIIMAERKKNND